MGQSGPVKIGKILKETRLYIEYTQVEMAKALNTSQSTIALCESGDRTPSIILAQKYIKLAKKHGINLSLDMIFME